FSFGEEHNYYLPLNGPLNREAALDGIRPYMERLIWVGWNASYDALVARNAGLPLRAAAGDGQCAAMVLQRKSRRLKDTTYELYEYRMETFKELIQEFGVKLISEVPLVRAAKYCSGDAYFGLRATKDLEGRLDSETSRQLYFEIEMPVHDILIRMTEVGLPLDVAGVEKLKEKYDEKLDTITQAIRDEVGDQEFNPNADRQIARVLFDELGLPVQRLTPTKQRSTDEMTLLKLKSQAPYLITLLLQWKHYDKIRGTYLIPLLKKHRNGRLQILWKQYRTSTGRLASEDPNAQNIPLDLRQFIAGNLAVADYSQLEMRIAGWLSGEQRLVDVFRRGEDVHDLTCQLIFGLKPGESKERPAIRVAAKAVNFAGKLYGAWGAKVQELVEREALGNPELDIRIPTIDEANGWIKEDQKAYPDFQKWRRWLIDSTRERGYSLTAYGRARVLPDITSQDPERRSAAEREAVSLAIQGTAADLCKMAMLRVDVIPGGVIIIQNHDEIVSEVLLETPGEQMEYALTMGKEMELGQPLVGKFAVPLVVDIGVGDNWDQAH
ncbi:MAG: hypothetical protein IIB72_04530, partial [Proteobacteria bacterium]|nr:hypothetical protein [Pseudomonadota bacterium]